MNELASAQIDIRSQSSQLDNSLNLRIGELVNFQSESRNLAIHLQDSLGSRINSVENFQFETRNLVEHLSTSLHSRLNSVETSGTETSNLVQHINTSVHTRLNTVENERLPEIINQIHEVIACQYELFGPSQSGRVEASRDERYRPAKTVSWRSVMQRAKQDFPILYPLWKERLDATRAALHVTRVGNAAWAGDVKSRIFRGLVGRFAKGRVLDVGCGVFGRPYYLESYPAELISGVEPLEPQERPDFELVRGISEYLPWPNRSFSTVISATSLDHCLSLDRSLNELSRVMQPNGCMLIWFDSVPGAPKYQPDSPDFSPVDKFHLFHFDVAWFEPMLAEQFQIVDRLELQRAGYTSIMYCLQARPRPPNRS
jgi:SAM-dependent methyltransferase